MEFPKGAIKGAVKSRPIRPPRKGEARLSDHDIANNGHDMRLRLFTCVLVLCALGPPAWGEPSLQTPAERLGAEETAPTAPTCLLVESAARDAGLPVEFFTRLIWRESRFRSDAVGPMTRFNARAQGIGQFMPATAAERGLLDPFNPVYALPKAAEYLSELRLRFGNLGLAAAAYNAGPGRVASWIAGSATLPDETERYVLAVTGLAAAEWKASSARDSEPTARGCEEVLASISTAPGAYVVELRNRIAQSAGQPWGVQLAAGFSRDKALNSYAAALHRLEPVVGAQEPILLQSILRSRGTRPFYQVRIGAESRMMADRLCADIRKAGRSCLVLRNNQRAG